MGPERSRICMIFGALPLAASVILLWRVPSSLSGATVFAWIALTFIFYDTMNTLTSVPCFALAGEQ